MPVATYTAVQQKIRALIKRFRFEELESAVMPIFPEISWNRIRLKLVKYHLYFTPANAALFITMAIAEKGLKEKALQDRLSKLELIDISWHSSRRIWYGHVLADSNKSANYITETEIQDKLEDHFYSCNMKVNVKVNTHNGIMYISLVKGEKAGQRKKIFESPIFVAYFASQKCFFCCKKNISADVLDGLLKSWGYKKSKRLKLMGRDLRSLCQLCRKKKEGALNSENVHNSFKYKNASPEKKDTGIDFTQRKQRTTVAGKCFGDGPPTLELVVTHGPRHRLAHKDILTKLPTGSMLATWEFRSENIAAYLRHLIERRILVTPLPEYVSNLMILGKNEISLRKD